MLAESPERWLQVKEILADALERDGPGRAALLDDVGARDQDLAREVRSLLGWYQDSEDQWSPGDPTPRAPLGEGTRLGPYEIHQVLDQGGMGTVYRARDTRLNRAVAVKVLSASGEDGVETARRFEREARTVASLSHPNILSIFDYGREGDVAYWVSELLLGDNLRARLSREALQVDEALRLGRQIARGLAAAHGAGIVHRDLKPENIFLCSDGTAKILDFGLAKRTWPLDPSVAPVTLETRAGFILGTVGYMAPEQVRGETVDARADVFAFGVVLYEMLSGRRPFDRGTPVETLAAVLRDVPPPLDPGRVPRPLEALVVRCLAKDRDARFASAIELSKSMDALDLRQPFAPSRALTRRAVLMSALTVALLSLRSPGPSAGSPPRPVDRVIRVGAWPSSMAVGNGDLWVANRESNNVTRIRTADGVVTGTFPAGEWPMSIAWDGRNVWVANHKWLPGDYSTLVRLDPQDGRILGTYRLPGQPQHLATDANHIWVAETWPTYLLRKLRLSDGALVGAFTAGGVPRQSFSDGESVWVSNGPIASITRIRASDGKLLAAQAVEGAPHNLWLLDGFVWLSNNASAGKEALLKLRASDLGVSARFEAPGSIAHAVSKRWFFVGEVGRILQRRTSDGSLVAAWAAGGKTSTLLFDGFNLWAADSDANTVEMISGTSLAAADRR